MLVLLIITLISAVWTSELRPEQAHPLSDEFIEYINSVQNTWTAGRNFHPKTSMEHLKKRLGLRKSEFKLPEKRHELIGDELPDEFDARKKWPYCKSLGEIQDQGNCGSCWAAAAAETMTDRYCIHSEGKKEFNFSIIDIATSAKHYKDCTGCDGGTQYAAWDYYYEHGVVSGGSYNSSTGCRPYPYRPCNHAATSDDVYPDCGSQKEHYYDCDHKCVTKDINYEQDVKRAYNVSTINKDEKQIMAEIYKNGPVEAGLSVYDDFFSYKKGVYIHTSGERPGGHAVKILGWGVENKVKYWLVANSWNEHWGDKGFFKILRGENHCGIEEEIHTGMPYYENHF